MKRIQVKSDIETKELINLVKQGNIISCPRCDSNLIVNFYTDPATQEKLPSNIYCPQNNNHFGVVLDYNLKSFWEDLEKKWENDRQPDDKK